MYAVCQSKHTSYDSWRTRPSRILSPICVTIFLRFEYDLCPHGLQVGSDKKRQSIIPARSSSAGGLYWGFLWFSTGGLFQAFQVFQPPPARIGWSRAQTCTGFTLLAREVAFLARFRWLVDRFGTAVFSQFGCCFIPVAFFSSRISNFRLRAYRSSPLDRASADSSRSTLLSPIGSTRNDPARWD